MVAAWILALLPLLGSAVSLAVWWWKRSVIPTVEQEETQYEKEYNELRRQIAAAERVGDFALADDLVRRLSQRQLPVAPEAVDKPDTGG